MTEKHKTNLTDILRIKGFSEEEIKSVIGYIEHADPYHKYISDKKTSNVS